MILAVTSNIFSIRLKISHVVFPLTAASLELSKVHKFS